MRKLFFISVASVFFLIPFEGTRVILFGVPVHMVEVGVIVSAIAMFLQRQRNRVGANNHSPLQAGIFLLLFGISSSLIMATSSTAICPLSQEGLLRALGILKSWFVFPILFGWILSRASHTYFSRENILFIFLVSFLPVSILSCLGWLFGSGTTFDGRLDGFFNSPNALAMYLAPAVILSWYFFRKYFSATNRDAKFCVSTAFACFLLTIFILFLTRSYSAWIAMCTTLFFFEIMKSRVSLKKFAAIFGIFFALTGTLALSQWDDPRLEHFFDPGSRSSLASRIMIWKSAGKMIADSPVFGVGPGNFGNCYLAYQRYFPPYLEWSVPEPHNIFLAFWLGSGLTGLVAFCFLIALWFRTTFLALKKTEQKDALLALIAIMLAILVHGLVDTPYWRMSLAYIFWIVFFVGISPAKTQRDAKSCVSTTCPPSKIATN